MSGDAEQFDVVIVGARCAGSPLATMLARRGLRVCLLDRSRFPSDSLSTHVIQPCGVQVLERLGVLDAAFAAGAVPVTRFTLLDEDLRIDAEIAPDAFGAPGLCLRRLKLDHLLVEAAAAAGAEVRTGAGVTGLLWNQSRVTGVETRDGALRASLVVGADGRSSTVASLVGASEYRVEPPGRLFSWAYFEGVDEDEGRLRLGHLGGVAYLSCPTDSTLFMAGVCPRMDVRDAYLADREGGFAAGIEGWPELVGLLAGARRVGPVRVLADWHGYLREAAGSAGFCSAMPGTSRTRLRRRESPTRCAKPSGSPTPSSRASTKAPPSMGSCGAGGAGAMRMPRRCTRSRPTSAMVPRPC